MYEKGEIRNGYFKSNIDELVDWFSMWQIDLNFKKCSVMHLGLTNPGFEYTIVFERNERVELKYSRLERDLVLYVSYDIKWASHIEEVVSKTNMILNEIALKTLILRLLSFSIVLWSDHTITMRLVTGIPIYKMRFIKLKVSKGGRLK